MYYHATSRALPHILIEVRNDLIETPEGQQKWANLIAPALWVAFENLENTNG